MEESELNEGNVSVRSVMLPGLFEQLCPIQHY